ncbi:MAG: M6 family metalloprotease domain-containing protein [Prevotella sp.]|nr:M6 family metalloprotease domain-containing protein [Prevotella sp.]MCM1074853.1 M6 family metalloprotease domain-containing protein [Ruminococcus sp.]
MKVKYLLSAALMAAGLSASAVPAYPGLIQRTLEDGTMVNVRLHGDEYFSYMTDEQGFLLEQKGNVLSYKMANGARIEATENVIAQMQKAEEASASVQMVRAPQMQRMAELNKLGRTNFCTTGDVHFLVLLVQYDDIKFSSPTIREDMNEMLNGENYTKNGAHGSMREYYIKNSNGAFRPTFDVSEVITLPRTSAYYTNGAKYGRVSDMVFDAVTLADPTVDFSKYCYTTAGECDAVILWYAGYGQADTADTNYIWPHQSAVPNYIADNTRIYSYCCFNELKGGSNYYNHGTQPNGIGTPVHEFGHVMGMPDLYDPNYIVKSTPGSWSQFDVGPYLGDGYCPPACSGYERWLFRWTEYEDVVDGTHYDLENLSENGRALRIPIITIGDDVHTKEYWVLETRKKEGWDEFLPGEGMLIWHIDYDPQSWIGNRVNSNEAHKRCHLITADGSANYDLGKKNAPTANAAWPYDKNYITPTTEITLKANYQWAKPFSSTIANIAYDSETGVTSFDYNIGTQPATVTTMGTPVRGLTGSIPNNEITLTWDAEENAEGYALTVYRMSGNKIVYESEFNDKPVGNVTSFTLPEFNYNKMKLEYHAFVRTMQHGLPSTEKSNEVVFTPNNLEAVSGIDSAVVEDTLVIGLVGGIQAPANAEIFNMQGQRCNASGLNPGVYMVRTGNKVTKVVVR